METDEEPVLAMETIESLRQLQSEDDPGFLARLLNTFLAHSTEQMVKLASAVQSGVVKDISKVAHGLKSSCFNVGAKRCGDICFTLEVLGESGDAKNAPKMLAELERELKAATAAIRALPEMRKT